MLLVVHVRVLKMHGKYAEKELQRLFSYCQGDREKNSPCSPTVPVTAETVPHCEEFIDREKNSPCSPTVPVTAETVPHCEEFTDREKNSPCSPTVPVTT